MATVDNIRNRLIDKILAIRNKNYLLALDRIIESGEIKTDTVGLTKEQELMLKMSEDDILAERTISDESIREKTSEWLKAKKV